MKNTNGMGKRVSKIKKCLPIIDELEMEELTGYPNIRITGDRAAVITGVRLVTRLTDGEISLDLDRISACICGESLSLEYLARSTIRIEGVICSISLEKTRKSCGGKA